MFESEQEAAAGLLAADPAIRREAAHYLAEQPTTTACEALLGALGDPDPRANEAIIQSVVAQAAPGRVARLVTVLREDPPARRNAALSVLIEIGAHTPEALTAALRHPSTEVRLHVAEVLGDLRDPLTAASLIQRLADPDEFPNVRHAAAQALGKIGDRSATPALVAAAEQGDFWIRYAAIEGLGRLGDERAVAPLLRLLQQDAWMRPATVQALGNIGQLEALPGLAAALDDPNDAVRTAAIEALLKLLVEPGFSQHLSLERLGELREQIPAAPLRRELAARQAPASAFAAHLLGWLATPEALGELIETLGDDDETLRQAAVEAILRYGPAAIPSLLEALQHRGALVRENAVELLGMLSDTENVPALLKLLNDNSVAVRQAVLRAAGTLGGEAAYAGLLLGLTDPATRDTSLGVIAQLRDPALIDYLRRFLYGGQGSPAEQASTRWAAAQALSLLGDEPAVSILLNAMRLPDDLVRQPAAEGLGRVRSTRAVPVLTEALGDRDWLVRQKAVEALGNISDGRAVTALLALVQEPEWRVRRALVQALQRIGDARVHEALLALAEDANRWIRRATMEASALLTDPRAIELLQLGLRDDDATVRRAALASLGTRREPAAAEAAAAGLADARASVRLAAIRALTLLAPEQAGARLATLAGSEPVEEVRLEIADALGELGTDEAVPGLEALLHDAAAPVRERAAEGLGNVGSPFALETLARGLRQAGAREPAQAELARLGAPAMRALLNAARSADADLRYAAAETLGQLRNPQAIPTLRLLTRDADARVRSAAITAIQATGAGAG